MQPFLQISSFEQTSVLQTSHFNYILIN